MNQRLDRSTAAAQEWRKSHLASSISTSVRSHSVADLRSEKLVKMGENSPSKIVRICHHCHTPQSEPRHAGIPTGVGRCTLDHWELCQLHQSEAYDTHGKPWTACPSNTDEVDVDPNKTLEKVTSDDDNSDAGEDTEAEEDRLALEELENLKKRVALQEQQIEQDNLLAQKLARKEKRTADRQRIEQQRAALLEKEKKLQGQRLSSSAPRLSSQGNPGSLTAAANLQTKAAAHASKQQKVAAEKVERERGKGMTIAGIRQLPGMAQQVNTHITNFQSQIPALANDHTADDQPQMPGVYGAEMIPTQFGVSGMAVEPGYVYVAELGRLVPTVSSLGANLGLQTSPMRNVQKVSADAEVSSDEDCPVSPSHGYKLVWHRDELGRKYCTEEVAEQPEIVATWVKRADGRIYKEESVRDTSRIKKVSKLSAKSAASAFVDHRKSFSQAQSGLASGRMVTTREDRQPTFLATDERGGKET